MIIAVDFDGTIVEHKYPQMGKEMLFAFETMKELIKQGHKLILWTYRAGAELEEAVEFCRKRGVEFYAINRNYPEEMFDESISRKILADVYIDDRNVGGFPGWSTIWQILNQDNEQQNMERLKEEAYGKSNSFFGKLKKAFKENKK